MTPPVDLTALTEALAKATPGPWESRVEPQHYPESHDADYPSKISGNGQHIAWLNERYGRYGNEISSVDAALIVTLVNTAPALIAEITALREERGRLRGALENIMAVNDPHIVHRVGAGDAMEKARAALNPGEAA